MQQKYRIVNGRCVALKDFSDVKEGDIGGFVASELNLSQDGLCWVYDRAIVKDAARVYDDARIYDFAIISDCAQVFEYARVFDHVRVYGYARVYGHARLLDNVILCNRMKYGGPQERKKEKELEQELLKQGKE